MSKKLMSVILVAVLVLSMGTMAMASVSAADELPAKPDGYNRYYFYMPESWYNEYATTAGIYWWEGTDACSTWPGYVAKETGVEGVYYYDVCSDVTTIIWNNAIDGGTDTEAAIYTAAYQTKNIGSEYYDAGESANYPDGTPNFDEMIYVVDDNKTEVNDFSGKSTFAGEWFYYYGNGEYGFTPEKGDVYFNERSYKDAPKPVTGDAPATEPVATEPAVKGANITVADETKTALVGDVITYTATLKTPKAIEDVQGFVTYDASALKLISCDTANLGDAAIVNTEEAGAVYFNASVIKGLDFTAELPVVTIEFEVLEAKDSAITLTYEEMTEKDGDSYYTESQKVNDAVVSTETLDVPVPPTTAPVTTAPATEAPATTVAGTDADKTDATSATDAPAGDKDVPTTGATVAIFAVLAVVAMAGAAVVVLRKKVNG